MLKHPEHLFSVRKPSETRDRFLQQAQDLADHLLTSEPYVPPPRMHGAKLIQVRALARETITLAGMFRLTQDERYAHRICVFLEDALTWTPWRMKPRTEMAFDLCTGEMAATFAYLLSWLDPWLKPELRQQWIQTVEEQIFALYTEAAPLDVDPVHRTWWYRAHMNWNSVCNGGVCALAYTLYDRSADAPVIAEAAMQGLQYYMDSLPQDGSSEESTGYWGFGNRYLFYALTAWEQHHGQPHPFLESDYYRRGLEFLLEFSPESVALGFGDSNKPGFTGWMLAAAERCGTPEQKTELTRRLLDSPHPHATVMPESQEAYPTEIAGALLADDHRTAPPARPALRMYPHNGWAVFRQQDLTLTFQAGSSDRYHSMRDALAVKVASGKQLMIDSLENHPYPRGWFDRPNENPRSQSRALYWEEHSLSKSAPCVNSVGQVTKGDTRWTQEETAVESDATALYPWFMDHVSRRVELEDRGFSVVDRFAAGMEEQHETRWITTANVTPTADGWRLERQGEELLLQTEADVPLTFLVQTHPYSILEKGSVTLLRAVLASPRTHAEIRTLILPKTR